MSSRQNTRNNRSTHRTFYQEISKSMLNELLHRASSGMLRQDIQSSIGSSIQVYVKLATRYEGIPKKISLYIIFKKQNIELGHVSFHMFPNDNLIKGDIGILHIRNISDGKRPLKINKQKMVL